MTESTVRVTLPNLCIPLCSERAGKIKLMEHQLKIRDSTSKFIVQNVPTSGGKTLASLLNVLQNNENAIFIYPTNALLQDQIENIRNSVELCGYSVRVLGEQTDQDSTEISILPVSGELLDRIGSSQGRYISHGRIIRDLMSEAEGSQVLMLTNPDILFLIIKGEFRTPLKVLKELLISDFRCIVLDEFHLYHGYSLANLFCLLSFLQKKIPKVIVSSATLSPEEGNALRSMSELYGKPEIITPTITYDGEGRIVRHKTDLMIEPIPSRSSYLYSGEDIEFLVGRIKEFYSHHEKDAQLVKVLIILNSVIFAEQMRHELEKTFGEEKVTPIHGLVPKKARLKPSDFSDIVIGTSAIEVGVDFDTASLIFEANNASSFIQRLGRGARHAPCETLALVPVSALKSLRKKLHVEEVVQHEVLTKGIKDSLGDTPTYEEFLRSEYSALLYLSLLYRFINALVISGKLSKVNHYEEIKRCVEKKQFQPPFFEPEELRKTLKKYFLNRLIIATSYAGFRDFSMEIPAFFQNYNVVQSISVLDLRKLKFRIEELDEFKKKLNETETLQPRKKREINATLNRFRFQHRNIVAVIAGMRGKPIKIYAGLPPSITDKLFIIDRRVTITGRVDSEFLRNMKQALNGIPGYHSYSREDWRFPAIPCKNGGFLFIGASALVKCFLENRKFTKRDVIRCMKREEPGMKERGNVFS